MRLFLIICALVFASSGVGNAKMLEETKHKNWNSFVLTKDGRSLVRMTTSSVTSTAINLFIVDFDAQADGQNYFSIILETKGVPQGIELQGEASLRVDKKEMINTKMLIETREGHTFLYLFIDEQQQFLRDCMQGSELRVKIQIPGQQSAYSRYSLYGFSEAFVRSSKLSDAVTEVLKNKKDSEYFENPAPRQKPKVTPPKSDAEYFI